MNIDGLSEATLEKFILNGFIKEFGDIYELEHYKDAIIEMDGFGEKSYENLIENIKKSSHTTLPRLVYALGIANIGVANAKVLCKEFDYDLQKLMQADEETISQIEGIGSVIAKSVTGYFKNEKNQRKLEHLLTYLTFEKMKIETGNPLSGKQFVITGSVNQFENRNAMKEFIENRGGKVTGSVSKKTDYLINNDTESSSSKNKKGERTGNPNSFGRRFFKTCRIGTIEKEGDLFMKKEWQIKGIRGIKTINFWSYPDCGCCIYHSVFASWCHFFLGERV